MDNKLSMWCKLTEKEKIDLLNDGVPTDCNIIVGSNPNSEVIRCHQAILSEASEVFRNMFTQNRGEDLTHTKIHLDNVETNTVQQFANFIYFRNKKQINKLSLQILQELVYLGENYKIKELSDICLNAIENIKSVVSLTDVANFYEFAHRVDNKKLIDSFNRKKNVWSKNIKEEQNDIYCSSIYDMSPAYFMDFIKVFANANVKHSFEMIQYYIKKNLSDKILDDENPGNNFINSENDNNSDNESEVNIITPKDDCENDESNPKNVEVNSKESEDNSEVESINRGDYNSEAIEIDDSENLKNDSEKQQQLTSSPSSSVDKKINNKLIINMLLNLIDFKRMSLVDFLNGPVNSDLLDMSTRLEILAEIVPKD